MDHWVATFTVLLRTGTALTLRSIVPELRVAAKAGKDPCGQWPPLIGHQFLAIAERKQVAWHGGRIQPNPERHHQLSQGQSCRLVAGKWWEH